MSFPAKALRAARQPAKPRAAQPGWDDGALAVMEALERRFRNQPNCPGRPPPVAVLLAVQGAARPWRDDLVLGAKMLNELWPFVKVR